MFKTWDGSRFHSHPRKNLNLHKAKSKINRCSNSLSRTGSSSRPLMPRETRRVLTPVVSELKEWNMLMEFSLRAKGGEHRMVSWLRCLLDVSHSAGNTRENLIFFKPRMSRRKRFNLSRLAISRGLPFHVERRDDAWWPAWKWYFGQNSC